MSVTTYGGRTFDAKPSEPDARDFPARLLVEETSGTVMTRLWRTVPRLDQGQEGDCVGFACAHGVGSYPRPQPVDDDLGHDIADLAKTLDEWEGEDYDGTSVRAGCKALVKMGRVGSYYRCNDVHEAILVVAHTSGVLLGVDWPESLMEPSVSIAATEVAGDIVGGHAVWYHGVHTRTDLHRIRNSWGTGYAHNGDVFVSTGGLVKLLGDTGEAWVLQGKALPGDLVPDG